MHEKVKGILQNAGNYWKVFKKNEILKKNTIECFEQHNSFIEDYYY